MVIMRVSSYSNILRCMTTLLEGADTLSLGGEGQGARLSLEGVIINFTCSLSGLVPIYAKPCKIRSSETISHATFRLLY